MFENIWYTFMVILIVINGFFVAMSFLPVSSDGLTTLGDTWGYTWGNNIIGDMNGSINVFKNQYDKNLGTNIPVDTNTEATTSSTDKIDPFSSLLFAAGTAFAMLGFMANILFGYFLWLDVLLNPAWHPLVGTLNVMLKCVFFLIEIVGIIGFAKGFFIFRNLF